MQKRPVEQARVQIIDEHADCFEALRERLGGGLRAVRVEPGDGREPLPCDGVALLR